MVSDLEEFVQIWACKPVVASAGSGSIPGESLPKSDVQTGPAEEHGDNSSPRDSAASAAAPFDAEASIGQPQVLTPLHGPFEALTAPCMLYSVIVQSRSRQGQGMQPQLASFGSI